MGLSRENKAKWSEAYRVLVYQNPWSIVVNQGYSEMAGSESEAILFSCHIIWNKVHFKRKILDVDLLYRRMMPMAEDTIVSMENSPSYFTSPPYDIPEMMKKGVPNSKLILLLCEPVKRVLSNFIQEVSLFIFILNILVCVHKGTLCSYINIWYRDRVDYFKSK